MHLLKGCLWVSSYCVALTSVGHMSAGVALTSWSLPLPGGSKRLGRPMFDLGGQTDPRGPGQR